MTEILLIRHGETDWNAERRLQGHIDIGLNAEGMRQAAAVGIALRDESLDAIFSSDLQRAQQTAQAIADACGMTVQTDAELRERCYGAFEGLRHSEMSERFPQEYLAWQTRQFDVRIPSGEREAETLREFSLRAVAAITRLANRFEGRKIAIVTHGGVLECVYRVTTGIGWPGPRDFEIRNASINRLHWTGSVFQLVQWSNIAHLDEMALDEIDK